MAYDKDKPPASLSLRGSNPLILANWAAIEAALNREHEFSTGGTAADQAHHKKGSARCFIQDAAPTTRRDTTAFTAEDNGSLWIDTNSSPSNQFNVLTDYAGPTWTPISTEIIAVLLAANRIFAGTLKSTGDFTVGANKVTVAAATGNTAVAGTLGITGIATLAKASLLASTDPPTTDAMLAHKKYVDDTAKTGADAMHDAEGGYNNVDVNGTKTKVYTKYLTGTFDASATKNVAHGITGVDKIMSVGIAVYSTHLSNYIIKSNFSAASATIEYQARYDGTNIMFTSIGSTIQSQKYRIKIDYIL